VKRALGWALLVVVALAAGLAANGSSPSSSVPSIDNRGPRGLAVLASWLRHRQTVLQSNAPLTSLPPGLASVVVAAPSAGELSAEEVDHLRTFVQQGGTLVYLAARDGPPQPALHRWLTLQWAAPAPPTDEPGLADVAGSTAQVTIAAGLFTGSSRLRLRAERTLALERADAVPMTNPPTVWWLEQGRGEVWVAAGPDLAENARLELLDNALPWAHLATRGPVLFDEFHHLRAAVAPTPVNLSATVAQLGVMALLFMLVFGSRLGPARPEPRPLHRSALEYVRALARMTAAAHVDDELIEVLRARVRALAHQRLGVSTELAWPEAVLLVETRQPGLGAHLEALDPAQLRAPSFLEASQQAAHFERALLGAEA
jgi:hypothetical protein